MFGTCNDFVENGIRSKQGMEEKLYVGMPVAPGMTKTLITAHLTEIPFRLWATPDGDQPTERSHEGCRDGKNNFHNLT